MVPNPNVCSTSYCVAWRVYSSLYSILCCAAPGLDMSILRHSVLSLDVSVQQQLIVSPEVSVFRSFCCPVLICFTTISAAPWRFCSIAACAVPGRSTAACADPKNVYSTAASAIPGGIWPTSGLCCTWTYMSTRACAVLHLDVSVYESLCCAEPGRVCPVHSNSRILRPKTVDRQRRREMITVRMQSYVSRLQKYWPSTPSPAGECVRPPTKAGVHTRRAERGVGSQYFGRRETLPSYSNNLSTVSTVQGDPDLETFQSPYFTFAKVHFPTSLQA